jgi:hypothetical protein
VSEKDSKGLLSANIRIIDVLIITSCWDWQKLFKIEGNLTTEVIEVNCLGVLLLTWAAKCMMVSTSSEVNTKFSKSIDCRSPFTNCDFISVMPSDRSS